MTALPHAGRRVALGLACAACALAAATSASAATGGTGTTGSTGSTGSAGSTGAAGATTAASDPVPSTNWAGYAVTASTAGVRNFKRVSASWVQPTATCTAGSNTYSAFWVGLGGIARSSGKLEQTGTEADCDAAGVAHYSAWYELVPAAPVIVKMAIAAGDRVSASVAVHGAYVTIELVDRTSGASITRRLRFPHASLSSAEWIAEAPSECSSSSRSSCRALPLTDFGTVSFADSSVGTGNNRTGTISDRRWSARAIELNDPASAAIGGGTRVLASRDVATATPSILDSTGSAFSVSFGEQQQTGPAGRSFPGA